jgi:hypothetical protein
MSQTQPQTKGETMTTAFQNAQAADIRREIAQRIHDLKAVGAVARIGFFHYPGMHSNLCTQDTVAKTGGSRCVKGDDPMTAIVNYAKSVWGGGKLRSEGRTMNDDGTYEESFLVFA